MCKSYLFIVTAIALIFTISSIPYLPSIYVHAAGCSSSNSFIVQCTAANTNGAIANSGTTSTLASSVTAGDGLIIVGGFASGNAANTVLQCSDNLAQTWTVAVHENQNPNSGLAQDSVICYKANSVGGSDAGTVTASSAAQGLIVVALYEVSPALSFTGILTTNICQLGNTGGCRYSFLGGSSGLCGPASWNMGNTNGSLILSVFGGNPQGTDDVIMTSGFSSIDTTNVNSPGDGNVTQVIAQGNGFYQGECLPPTGHWASGVEAIFGPFTLTTTLTVTAWNTIGVSTPSNWIVLALMLLFFPALTWGLLKGFDAPPSTTIFGTLVALFFGSVIGVIGDFEAGSSAVFPFGIVVADAVFLAVYLFRSRSRSGIS